MIKCNGKRHNLIGGRLLKFSKENIADKWWYTINNITVLGRGKQTEADYCNFTGCTSAELAGALPC